MILKKYLEDTNVRRKLGIGEHLTILDMVTETLEGESFVKIGVCAGTKVLVNFKLLQAAATGNSGSTVTLFSITLDFDIESTGK